ncbi:tachykinin peptides receptor 86C-like [Tropilaelaps mercedesae]|uniref:Tachykinin peptides receptor 86C-like n=1 Tax=Tropilaelaps mercedesae TaxID=418985 RepID=A0A1V9XKQ6_9ACAR|nr:tachykinin peptides receptor 86C-like [Tropilaelaps mercedesae]
MTFAMDQLTAAALNSTMTRCLKALNDSFAAAVPVEVPSDCVSLLDNVTTADGNITDLANLSNGSFPGGVAASSSLTFLLPLWLQVTFIMCFSLIVFAGVLGNAIVIWIVLAHQRMRTVTNYFLVNLSVADLTTAMFNVIFNAIFMMHSHWPFGALYCRITNFISLLTVTSSVFTITAMSIDRTPCAAAQCLTELSGTNVFHGTPDPEGFCSVMENILFLY